VSSYLRRNDVRLDHAAVFYHSGGGFIARAFYAEHEHRKSFYTTGESR
jgi:hypothetical protein